MAALPGLRPARLREAAMLLAELVRRGGVAVEAPEMGDADRVRVALLPDGTAMLRYRTPPIASTAAAAVAVLEVIAARLERGAATFVALRVVADLAVAGAAIATTAVLLLGDAGRDRILAYALGLATGAFALRLRRPLARRIARRIIGGLDA